MKEKKKIISVLFSLSLIGILWFPKELTVCAEEITVPGYHEYKETDDEKIDHWYGISRGTYLKDGTCGIKRAEVGKVSVSGTTTAHRVCDKVRVSVYLDESTDGGSSYGQIGSYYFSEDNTATCHGSKTYISVTSGRMYRARGGHSVTKGSTTESTDTRSGGIIAS